MWTLLFTFVDTVVTTDTEVGHIFGQEEFAYVSFDYRIKLIKDLMRYMVGGTSSLSSIQNHYVHGVPQAKKRMASIAINFTKKIMETRINAF